MMLPKKLQHKIEQRINSNSLRLLDTPTAMVDFYTNDYLGLANSPVVFEDTHAYLTEKGIRNNGATGSRLLSGNHPLYNTVEQQLSVFHNAEAALVFNSGYTANLGFFSAVPQRNDVVLYDVYVHASIRDGIKLSNAKAYAFNHNCLADLTEKLKKYNKAETTIYVVTETVFSMDGDIPELKKIATLCNAYNARLVVDEAHAIGVVGNSGKGLTEKLRLESLVFARIITFGKALGCHGAAILGSKALKEYLINFSRPFIYTTALPPHAVANIHIAYKHLNTATALQQKLAQNIQFFKSEIARLGMMDLFIKSNSAIHCIVISENEKVKYIAQQLQEKGFMVKPILSPTVPSGKERLRFCVHAYNTTEDITQVLTLLKGYLKI